MKKKLCRWFTIDKNGCELETCSKPIFATFRELEVIVFKVDFLGDFFLAIPALTALKEKIKSDKIDIIVGEWNVGIAKRTGLFRNIYTYNGLARYEIDAEKLQAEKKILQENLPHYDMAIELRRGSDAKNLMQWIHADCKIGARSYREANRILDICLDSEPDLHESMQMMRIVDAVPVRVLDLPRVGTDQVAKTLAEVSLFPFAGNPRKEWPLANYVELTRQISGAKWVAQINIFCSAVEAARCGVFAGTRNVRVLSQQPVDELISLLSESRIVISNDSFGAHLAAYLQIPVVAIYSGQTRPLEWQPSFGPMSVLRKDISCSRCDDAKRCLSMKNPRCLQEIQPEDVLGEMDKVLARGSVKEEKTSKVMLLNSRLRENELW